MAAEFSLAQEILKEIVGFGGAVALAGVTLWIALASDRRKRRSDQQEVLAEHRRQMDREFEKQRLQMENAVSERRDKYIAETLIGAYRDIEALSMRGPGFLGMDRLTEYRQNMERAIGEVQLLGDAKSAEIAFELCNLTSPAESDIHQKEMANRIEVLAKSSPGFNAATHELIAREHQENLQGWLLQLAQQKLLFDLMVAMRVSVRRQLRYENTGETMKPPAVLRFLDDTAHHASPAEGIAAQVSET